MSKLKKTIFYMFMVALLSGLTGCEREGPMEHAGKKVDKFIEDTDKAIKDAGRKKDEKKE